MISQNIKTTHLNNLTDQFGIWQHHEQGKVLEGEGYALDDSARGLIVWHLYNQLDKAEICLSYLENSVKDRKMIGFFWADKSIRTFPSSDDAFALGYRALAYCVKNNFYKERALAAINRLDLSILYDSHFIRTQAYTLIAESMLHNEIKAAELSQKIQSAFNNEKNWFEDKLTYANAIIPLSLLTYADEFDKLPVIETIARKSIATLERYCRIGKIPAPIGNRIWQQIGNPERDPYGQQPIDAAFMVFLLTKAFKVLKDEKYKIAATEWMEWFYGNNIMKVNLVNDEGACADGIDEDKISGNYGAESTIVYLWAAKEYEVNFS